MTVGIYKITNGANSKIYIGKSIDIDLRLQQHLYALRNNTHRNKRLRGYD